MPKPASGAEDMRGFVSKVAAAACCALIVIAAGVAPAMAKGWKIHIHVRKIEHSVSHAVHHATRSVQRGVKHATRKVTRTAKKVERGTKKAVRTVRRTTDRAVHTVERGTVHVADKVGAPAVKVVDRTTHTVVHAVEHPKETIEALEKTAVNLERYATMDVSDIMHGNIRKLMRDTARQQSAINRGISRDTGVSVGVLKVIEDLEGAALAKAAARVAENPRAALAELKKDARAAAAAARTDAADIASGNAAKLLRDMTNQQASVMGAVMKTEVQLSGLPVPKSMMRAALTYQATMLKMMSGQGAAEIIEAIARGKTGDAFQIAMRDSNTLQGTDLTNAANSQIHKLTGISTAVLSTAEQIAGAFVGGGQEAVASDAAKVVAEGSVKAAEEDAVKAGVKAATDDAARQATRSGSRQATTTVDRQATTTGTRQATRQATRDTAGRVGTRAVTSPGAREAEEVIPQGIVRQRIEFFEGLSRTGTRTGVEDATSTGARTATQTATRTATQTATTAAGKGFDDMVKSRLQAAAEDAAKEATRNGLSPRQVEQFTRAAVRKAGSEITDDTANFARYAVIAARPGSNEAVLQAVAKDAAELAVKTGSRRAAEAYMARWSAVEASQLTEVAARSGAHMTPTFVARSLIRNAAEETIKSQIGNQVQTGVGAGANEIQRRDGRDR